MNFKEAWEAFQVGDEIVVSHPTKDQTVWHAHNFEGVVAEKLDTAPRAMRIEFENELGNLIGHTITEDMDNKFAYCETTLEADPVLLEPVLVAKIDQGAGEYRKKFITDIPGQETVYRLKEEQAKAWLAATDPVLADYVFIKAETEATGLTGNEAAQLILDAASAAALRDSKIEAARRSAKVAVANATTKAEKEAASIVDWNALTI